MPEEVAIKVDRVSKTFKLPHEKNNSIKGAVVNFYRRKKSYEKQKVLDDISFEINKGEFFGIVGKNGGGKSTLLKMLAGIYSPSKGKIEVKGKLIPFIELGVGFNPELTGRENIFLNGALLGFSRKQMNLLYEDIVEFAELEKFMDQKLKNYSSGMQVRLAFSIAIRAQGDILLLDEVLAVGDADFQRKCLQYFQLLKRNKQTVVFVSHDMESVRKYCDRIILIEKGKLRKSGTPNEVIPTYMGSFLEGKETGHHHENNLVNNNDVPLGISSAINTDDSFIKIKSVWLENAEDKKIEVLKASSEIYKVIFEFEVIKQVRGIIPGIIVTNENGEFIIASNSKWSQLEVNDVVEVGKKYKVKLIMDNIFEQGTYKISINVVSKEMDTFYAWKNEAYTFYVDKPYLTGGKSNPNYVMEISKI